MTELFTDLPHRLYVLMVLGLGLLGLIFKDPKDPPSASAQLAFPFMAQPKPLKLQRYYPVSTPWGNL